MDKHNLSDCIVLAAEDAMINRGILSQMLLDTGISIEYAENGRTALEMFSKNPEKYDIILMDINMPGMNGLEGTRKIRALGGRGKDIPIIAMTANVNSKDIEKHIAAGMNSHIGKPVNRVELVQLLNEYIDMDRKRENYPS